MRGIEFQDFPETRFSRCYIAQLKQSQTFQKLAFYLVS
jgi:hypothetical protein